MKGLFIILIVDSRNISPKSSNSRILKTLIVLFA